MARRVGQGARPGLRRQREDRTGRRRRHEPGKEKYPRRGQEEARTKTHVEDQYQGQEEDQDRKNKITRTITRIRQGLGGRPGKGKVDDSGQKRRAG
jgi:hypothetical protein